MPKIAIASFSALSLSVLGFAVFPTPEEAPAVRRVAAVLGHTESIEEPFKSAVEGLQSLAAILHGNICARGNLNAEQLGVSIRIKIHAPSVLRVGLSAEFVRLTECFAFLVTRACRVRRTVIARTGIAGREALVAAHAIASWPAGQLCLVALSREDRERKQKDEESSVTTHLRRVAWEPPARLPPASSWRLETQRSA